MSTTTRASRRDSSRRGVSCVLQSIVTRVRCVLGAEKVLPATHDRTDRATTLDLSPRDVQAPARGGTMLQISSKPGGRRQRHVQCRSEDMKIDRLAFLALASSLSVACSSQAEEVSSDEGAAHATQCVQPGAESAKLSSDDSRFCEDLATRAEASPGKHDWTSVNSVCLGYLTSFRSAPARAAKQCMTDAGKRISDDFWTALYGCGFSSLASVCPDAAATSTCQPLGGQNAAACPSILSGLETSARADVESCAKTSGFGVYSCVEGIEPHYRGECTAPGSDPTRSLEGELRALCKREIPAAGAAQDLCVRLVGNAQPSVAQAIMNGLHAVSVDKNGDPRTVSEAEMYKIGLRELHAACRQPADVDGLCREGVAALVANGGSNAGGRLTNECRSLLAGLKPSARRQMTNLMTSIQNAAEYTRSPGGLSRMINLLVPCLEPARGVCEDNSQG